MSIKLLDSKVGVLSLSYFLMVIGLVLLSSLGSTLFLIVVATLFIYLPVYLRLYGLTGKIAPLGRFLSIALNVLIVIGEMLCIFGFMALVVGIIAAAVIGGLNFVYLIALPLFVSSILFLKVSFGLKKGAELLYSYIFLFVIFIALGYLVVIKS